MLLKNNRSLIVIVVEGKSNTKKRLFNKKYV